MSRRAHLHYRWLRYHWPTLSLASVFALAAGLPAGARGAGPSGDEGEPSIETAQLGAQSDTPRAGPPLTGAGPLATGAPLANAPAQVTPAQATPGQGAGPLRPTSTLTGAAALQSGAAPQFAGPLAGAALAFGNPQVAGDGSLLNSMPLPGVLPSLFGGMLPALPTMLDIQGALANAIALPLLQLSPALVSELSQLVEPRLSLSLPSTPLLLSAPLSISPPPPAALPASPPSFVPTLTVTTPQVLSPSLLTISPPPPPVAVQQSCSGLSCT